MSDILAVLPLNGGAVSITTRGEDGKFRAQVYEPVPDCETELSFATLKEWMRVVKQCGGLAPGGRKTP